MTHDTMTVDDYGALLSVGAEHENAQEAFWDTRAADYDRAQQRDDGAIADGVVAHLASAGILTGARVLDVGAGAGRYALRLAPRSAGVHLADVSGRMLDHARRNLETAGISPLGITRADWGIANLDALGWRGGFDVVFVSMVPAVRSREGIDRMTAASRGWCVVARTARRRDSLADRLRAELDGPDRYDPGNDQRYPRALMNYLWLQDRPPTIAYVTHHTTEQPQLDDAIRRYGFVFDVHEAKRHHALREIIAACAVDGRVPVEREQVTAVISWQV